MTYQHLRTSATAIPLFSGGDFEFETPDPSAIEPLDIAVALSRIPRFNGHTELHYTVGQHSILASYQVPPRFALEALLHDAAEAYTGDLVRPLKMALEPNLARIEEPVEWAVAKRFGLPVPLSEEVAIADARMLATEVRDLLKRHVWSGEVAPYPEKIVPWKRSEVLARFVDRWQELTHGGVMVDQRLLPLTRKDAMRSAFFNPWTEPLRKGA